MQWIGGREDKKVWRVLKRLSTERTPVTVEVERYNVRFPAVLALRRKHVLVSRPGRVSGLLHRHGTLRFADPAEPSREVRLEINHPTFILSNGSNVIVCDIPSQFVQSNQRQSPRFNTTNLKNLMLFVPQTNRRYRIVDLSEHGCKLRLNGEAAQDPLVAGAVDNWEGRIMVGTIGIDLARVQPRAVGEHTVGCAFETKPDEEAHRRLKNLLQAVERNVSARISPSLTI